MIIKRSAASHAETVERLLGAIEQHGLTVFARIDHAEGARAAGLELDEEQVVLFGDARAGTPLMRDDRRIGIELPLRMLVWREEDGVLVGYGDPRELIGAYDVAGHEQTLGQMAALLESLAGAAAGIPQGERP